MRVDQFDFDLPEDRIALRPACPRDSARLLVVRGGRLEDRTVRDLPDILFRDDLAVFNDTRVLRAQLEGRRAPRHDVPLGQGAVTPGVRIEATLHKRAGLNCWWAFLRPAKRIEIGDRITFAGSLAAQVKDKGEGGEALLAFEEEGERLDAEIDRLGAMPLPPYIARRRAVDDRDTEDYQTVYAGKAGAVAAPTAGLHFTPELLKAMDAKGIARTRVTLHVGAGTFLPVKAEDTESHRMHAEWGEVSRASAEAVAAARARGGRIVSTGTTSLRLLESAAREDGTLEPFRGETDIFITPGYRFRAVDVLLTNFHLPRSTLFMLVSAFCGLETMQRAYAHAIETGYRFYSYGDATLLFREGRT